MDELTVNQLNTLAKTLKTDARVKFYNGDLFNVVRAIAPHGRIAALYTKETFYSCGKAFTERLKAAGIKPLNFILPENTALNLENVFDLIGVPDGVRAIVCFDRRLADVSAYLATIFKIPVVLALKSVETEGILPSKVPFYMGGSLDFFPVNCAYHVVLPNDENGLSGISEQFISIMSNITALTDYKVRLSVCGGKAAKIAYEAVKSAVLDVFATQNPSTLLISGLKIEVANLATGGAIAYNSADYCFRRLAGFNLNGGVRLTLIKKLLTLYLLCAEELNVPFKTPDYNARARELAVLTKSDDGVFLQGFMRQINRIKHGKGIEDLKKLFKKEFAVQNDASLSIEEKYLALGGVAEDDFTQYIKALKHCGDLPNAFNFMTLVREGGFTEYF